MVAVIHRPRLGRCGDMLPPEMVNSVEAAADGDNANCVWQPRDRRGWRNGVVFSGSADLLTAWHAAQLTTSPGSRAAADKMFEALIDRIRQARLRDSADE